MSFLKVAGGMAPAHAAWTRATVVSVLGFLWVTLFWFEPAQQWPGWRELDRSLDRLLEGVLSLERPFAWAARSWAFVLFPVVLLSLSGRRPGLQRHPKAAM